MEQLDKIKKAAGIGDEAAYAAGKVRNLAVAAHDKALEAGKAVAGKMHNGTVDIARWAGSATETVKSYYEHFSVESFVEKLRTSAMAAGKTVVAQALLIYYTIRRD